MIRILALAAALIAAAGAASAQDSRFAVGQEWTLLKINSLNGGANFVISKIEDRDGVRIIHGSELPADRARRRCTTTTATSR